MKHAVLVERAARWLKRSARGAPGCKIVFAEMVCTAVFETPDAIGWDSRGSSHVIECKTSRADFRREQQKTAHRLGCQMGRFRYYLSLPDVLLPTDLPEDVGLLVPHRRGLKVIVPPRCRDLLPAASCSEAAFLVAAIRRYQLGVPWLGDQHRFRPYSDRFPLAAEPPL
jgi:hypothetical protein